MQYFVVFLTALFISTVLVALLVKFAEPLRFVDIPDQRKIHGAAIPRVGGIGMVSGTIIASLLWLASDNNSLVFFYGVGVLSVFGILDDRFNLAYQIKLLGQFIAVLIVVFGGNVLIRDLSLLGIHSLPDVIAYPLTIVFLVGATNAMNMSDGLDGLAAGLSMLSLACLAYLALLGDADPILACCIAIIGATFGFLRYNTHPAMVFMGDSGSQFLGFSVGVLSLTLTQEFNTALSRVLPLLIIGLPIVDTLRVIGERVSCRVSPFKADRRHFHHKLLDMGFDHYEAVLVIYVIQAVFVLLAVVLRYESDILILLVYGILFIALCGLFPLANTLDWRRPTLGLGEKSLLTSSLGSLIEHAWLEKTASIILSVVVPAFLLLGVLLNPLPNTDLSLLAGAMLAAWLLSTLPRIIPLLASVTRVAIYFCVTLVVYTIGINEHLHPELERYFLYALAAIAFLVAMGVIFSPQHFSITPSDYLVMFILVASASLPIFGEINYARLAAESSILVYALEYVLRRQGLGGKVLQIACFLVLGLVTFRGYQG